MLYNILLIVQLIVSLGIIALVLMQHGKGADAGAAFGGGASGSVFGSKGSGNFMSRTTAILATIFFVNSLLLAWIVAHPEGAAPSVIESVIPAPAVESNSVPSDVPVPAGTAAPVDKSDVPVAPKQE